MQALNHVAFGTLIAITVKQPVLVAPLTLMSHFALDVLPHYGEDPKAPRGSNWYHFRIVVDILASLLFVGLASSRFSDYAEIVMLGSLLAILPDFFWPLALYIKPNNPLWSFFRFHKGIQKFETRNGIYVEIVWFVVVVFLLANIRNY